MLFSSKIVETEVKVDNFALYFWSKSLGKNWISGDIGGLFYMF